ncbi:DUF1127 domain-containing protein [Breoghania sp. JC706]|uniref:DUF1127 domain-containing protein n=1 Tax=Breoghania sp. JC706 TaxID=3117732 RepID=UPI0030099008
MSLTAYDARRSTSGLVVDKARTALRLAASLAMNMVRAYRARRTLSMLASQEDYMLRDIGVSRSDLYAALSTPATEDPSMVLARLADERQKAERSRRRAVARNRRTMG